jgi:flagellar protein FlaF
MRPNNQLEAYHSVEKATLPGREIEARVLTQAALKLKDCQRNWDTKDRAERLDKALKFNQHIWSIFQSELGRPDNPFPTKLKIDLLRLSAFIDKRVFEIMAHPQPERLSIIIDINHNIAAGLRNSP